MDLKDMILALMMMDFDKCGIGKITIDVRDSIVDKLVGLEKSRRELEADREILSKDVNYHNCNTCKRDCDLRPKPGERVRANCYYWVNEDGEQE